MKIFVLPAAAGLLFALLPSSATNGGRDSFTGNIATNNGQILPNTFRLTTNVIVPRLIGSIVVLEYHVETPDPAIVLFTPNSEQGGKGIIVETKRQPGTVWSSARLTLAVDYIDGTKLGIKKSILKLCMFWNNTLNQVNKQTIYFEYREAPLGDITQNLLVKRNDGIHKYVVLPCSSDKDGVLPMKIGDTSVSMRVGSKR